MVLLQVPNTKCVLVLEGLVTVYKSAIAIAWVHRWCIMYSQ